MLDNIQKHNDVHLAEPGQSGLIGYSIHHRKPTLPAERSRRLRDFDSRHIVEAPRLFQEKAIGAADLQQPPAVSTSAQEIHCTRKLAPQDGFAAAIVGITVSMSAGEIILCVVVMWIEVGALGTAKATLSTLENVARIFGIEFPVRSRARAGRAIELHTLSVPPSRQAGT